MSLKILAELLKNAPVLLKRLSSLDDGGNNVDFYVSQCFQKLL